MFILIYQYMKYIQIHLNLFWENAAEKRRQRGTREDNFHFTLTFTSISSNFEQIVLLSKEEIQKKRGRRKTKLIELSLYPYFHFNAIHSCFYFKFFVFIQELLARRRSRRREKRRRGGENWKMFTFAFIFLSLSFCFNSTFTFTTISPYSKQKVPLSAEEIQKKREEAEGKADWII